jgi:hypothetical protein
MAALLAQIVRQKESGDSRRSGRRTLRLRVSASVAESSADAVIHNLSEDGLLLETGISLKVGDRVGVELPRSRGAVAVVIWARDNLYGCKFEREISRATVSAALLLSPARPPALNVGELIPSVEPMRATAFPAEPEQSSTPERVRVLLLVALFASLIVVAMFVWALLALPPTAS